MDINFAKTKQTVFDRPNRRNIVYTIAMHTIEQFPVVQIPDVLCIVVLKCDNHVGMFSTNLLVEVAT